MTYCTSCGESIAKARLVLAGRAVCGDCAYELEHGPVERVKPPEPWKRGLYPQEEFLFPLPPPRRASDHRRRS